jgi:hypothetical protein
MIVFTPWAFGTTQEWSTWTMNISAFALGLILLTKRIIRRQTGYRPPRWSRSAEGGDAEVLFPDESRHERLAIALAVLTVVVLGWTLTSAINWRATYLEWQRRFEYRDCINWLPHSYDSTSTWRSFWEYLGLACFFWATRDWLLGRTAAERHANRHRGSDRESHASPGAAAPTPRPWRVAEPSGMEEAEPATLRHGRPMPGRLQLVLWVLCINGAILALEAILQRLSGTDKLLWLVQPRYNEMGVAQFGPYAYRANAASYFNLLWPVCFGFWFVLRSEARRSIRRGHRLGSGNHLVLLPGAVLMAACPIISTSRGGALVGVAMILVTMGLLLWLARRESLWFRLGTCSLFAIIIGFSAYLGFKQLAPRFQTIFTDQMSRRTEIYENALPIAHDFPMFGTGPGTFGSLYQLYRKDVTQQWAAYVHDDWLETRITFGTLGMTLVLLMLVCVPGYWFLGKGMAVPWELPAMIWVAMGGGLLHAKFDFPFQIYSILFVFVFLSAVLFSISQRHGQSAA